MYRFCGKPPTSTSHIQSYYVLKPSPNGLAWFSTNRLMGNHPSMGVLMGTESRNGGYSVAMFEGCLTTRVYKPKRIAQFTALKFRFVQNESAIYISNFNTMP
jgi:hypothetical protein